MSHSTIEKKSVLALTTELGSSILKVCNRNYARENTQPEPSAGKLTTVVWRRKHTLYGHHGDSHTFAKHENTHEYFAEISFNILSARFFQKVNTEKKSSYQSRLGYGTKFATIAIRISGFLLIVRGGGEAVWAKRSVNDSYIAHLFSFYTWSPRLI